MKLLSPGQIVLRIAIIISLVELLIMLVLESISYRGYALTEAVIDTVFLVLLSSPFVYLWVIKPFVDAREKALLEIEQLALTDPLTKLANCRLIEKYFVKILASCIRHEDYAAVMLIDLDDFKPVNDNWGHDAGDAVLVEIASRLLSSIRAEDVVGRLGGDEFVVLVHHLGKNRENASEMVNQVAGKLIKEVCRPIEYNSKIIQVGGSIGIRLLSTDDVEKPGSVMTVTESKLVNISEAFMKQADIALYRAKATGKSCSVIFE